MTKPLILAALLLLPAAAREPLRARIAHTDPSKYSVDRAVHGGAGELHYTALFDEKAFYSNLLFLHRGVIPPKGGIGHHYHNQMEEMFVIFDNQAQFTIDGRTSLLDGPVGAPCRQGRSHAIYNPTDRPVEWMNVAVATVKGRYDNYDLDDDRVGAPIEHVVHAVAERRRRNRARCRTAERLGQLRDRGSEQRRLRILVVQSTI